MLFRSQEDDFGAVPDDILAEHVRAYRAYHALPLRDKIELYPLHLVVVTPDDELTPQWRALLSQGKEVYNQGGYRVVSLL